ncbi:hypothetical protein QR98_0082900 [Sarcoptes scabiei]|uniref:Uncharacterized protein n=1 Tax=Sarcoptes scabiei TaxID=52283 RepID=A0A132AGQ7_SARSC|nr:hypothetical protein QR98_0082900 [Sarcoptes scabiei]
MQFSICFLIVSSSWLVCFIEILNALPSSSSKPEVLKCSAKSIEAYDNDIAKLMTIGHRYWPETFQQSKEFCVKKNYNTDFGD